ncbi:MAG TPA: hypothetical protein VIG24_07005 [Acidimicrobiia bacterium]
MALVPAIGTTPAVAAACSVETPPINGGFYELSTPGHLEWLRADNSRWAANYRLTGDIDMITCATWTSVIGTASHRFEGVLDGQGHSITNLDIEISSASSSPDYVGLIGYAGSVSKQAEIRNLTVDIPDLEINGTTATSDVYIGVVAGYFYAKDGVNNTDNLITSGSITVDGDNATPPTVENLWVGGVFGRLESPSLTPGSASHLTSSVDIGNRGNFALEDYMYVGGIVGESRNTNLDSLSTSGDAIFGVVDFGSDVYAHMGGAVGYLAGGSLETVTSTGDVYLQADGAYRNAYVGGAVGYVEGGDTSEITASGAVDLITADIPASSSNSNGYAGGAIAYVTGANTTHTSIRASGAVILSVNGLGTHRAGGALGYVSGSSGLRVSEVVSRGDLTVDFENGVQAGGSIGHSGASELTDITSSGNILVRESYVADSDQDSFVGGVGGYFTGACVRCSSTGTLSYTGSAVEGDEPYIGGIAGWTDGAISRSFSTGAVSAQAKDSDLTLRLGGIAGRSGSTITESYSTGAITASSDPSASNQAAIVGGILGDGAGSPPIHVIDSYSRSDISAAVDNAFLVLGGVVGGNASVLRVYSSGTIAGTTNGTASIGGLIGAPVAWGTETAEASFCLEAISPSVCAIEPTDPGVPLPLTQLKVPTTYIDAGWSITPTCSASTTWGICSGLNDGLPYLSALSARVASASTEPAFAQFVFQVADGRECTSISPVRVEIGSRYTLPGTDALCRSNHGSRIEGWTIPVPPGFTGAGSTSLPFSPGHVVEVSDSQQFTAVTWEPVLSLFFDANVAQADTCDSNGVPHATFDDQGNWVWVPRTLADAARLPSIAACTPPGYQLMGWNTRGDGTGELLSLGAPLPQAWWINRPNERTLYAMWKPVTS